jgi:YidC/Oxa1 family membrane protein insertase
MGVMFYWVPSGLGLYFITSSLWAIGERLVLPKVSHAHPVASATPDAEVGDEKSAGPRSGGRGVLAASGSTVRAGGRVGPGGNGSQDKPLGRFAQFWERVLEEARKDQTYRKMTEEREDKSRDKDKGDPRPRPRRR